MKKDFRRVRDLLSIYLAGRLRAAPAAATAPDAEEVDDRGDVLGEDGVKVSTCEVG